MTALNTRQIEFVKLLLGENCYNTIKKFAVCLNTSDKTLKKDLNVIEKYLSEFNIELDRKPGTGIRIKKDKNIEWVLYNSLNTQENEVKNISIYNRRIEITKKILLNSCETTSIQKLSDQYYVSKTSIANDLKYIEKWLLPFHLKLNKTVGGTKIDGKEINIRQAIAALLLDYKKEENKKEILDLAIRLDAVTLNTLSEIFETDKIIYINNVIGELEKKYNCKLYDPYYINLLTHILISLKRGAEGNEIEINAKESDENFKSKKAYEEAVSLIWRINNDMHISLGYTEVYYLYRYFISSGLIKENLQEQDGIANNIQYLADIFAKELTSYVEKIMQIPIFHDESVLNGLLLHIRPMLNRLAYDIQIKNQLIKNIQGEYPELFNICKAASLLTAQKLLKKEISEDEIGYIALYYQIALEKASLKKQVLVVCHSGYGTSQLLTTRLKKVFPQWNIADIISADSLKKRSLKEIDFIVSTVPLEITEKPYILVSVFLNEQDIKNISNNLLMKKPITIAKQKIAGTNCIAQFLCEKNIFFNRSKESIFHYFQDNGCTNMNFKQIEFGRNVIVYLNFFNGTPQIVLGVNTIENLEKQITFYVAMNDIEVIANLFTEIYHLYSQDTILYLKKCHKSKDIIHYFQMNQGGKKVVEVNLSQVIQKETIKLDLKAQNKEEALKELTELLFHAGFLSNAEEFLKDVYYRESLGATGIGNGIAIPHGKSQYVSRTSLALGKLEKGIEWETLDDSPVHFIILFAVTEQDKDSAHIRLLSQVATKLADDEICAQLIHAETPEQVYQIFSQE